MQQNERPPGAGSARLSPGRSRAALRRARGAVLRLAFDRRVAAGTGVALVAPAVWLRLTEHPWEGWLSDGLALLCGATGAAFVAFAAGGRRPDWIDPDR